MFAKRFLDMKLYYRGIRGLVGLLVQKELMEFRLVLLFFLFFFLFARNWANFLLPTFFLKNAFFKQST